MDKHIQCFLLIPEYAKDCFGNLSKFPYLYDKNRIKKPLNCKLKIFRKIFKTTFYEMIFLNQYAIIWKNNPQKEKK